MLGWVYLFLLRRETGLGWFMCVILFEGSGDDGEMKWIGRCSKDDGK